ncbi:MAG: NTP transferase domain-containing protein [Verrucomicrobiota bacterium]
MNLSAALLAGGESRRMGADKATLLFRGKPLWQNQLDLLRHLQPAEIFVSAKRDPDWRPNNVQFIADDSPSRGPLSGLAACLSRIQTRHLLVLAVDMPFMSEAHLRFLCDQTAPGCGILPIIGDRIEPLAAIYPIEADVDVTAALFSSDFSMKSLTNRLVKTGKLRVSQVSGQHENFYRNLNEPADLAQVTDASKGLFRSSNTKNIKIVKRIIVGIIGGTVLLIGFALIVLPGPAFIVIPIGLAILATEFAWAGRWLKKVRQIASSVVSRKTES